MTSQSVQKIDTVSILLTQRELFYLEQACIGEIKTYENILERLKLSRSREANLNMSEIYEFRDGYDRLIRRLQEAIIKNSDSTSPED